jgi:DNA-directed RNA polymerase specialized sigma24 family protein
MSDEPKDLSREAIDRALAGDAVAFRRFYLHYDPTIRWAVGLRVYRWPQLVPLFDDIVQEVWARLVCHDCKVLRYYKQDRDVPFGRFLAFIATRLGWRVAKRNLRHPEPELVDVADDDDWGFVMRMLHHDFLERLMSLVRERLDDTDVALFEGFYLWGHTIRQIAERLSINENTAYQRHGRLRNKLAALAEELLGERTGSRAPELVAMLVATALLLGEGGDGSPLSRAALEAVGVEVTHE